MDEHLKKENEVIEVLTLEDLNSRELNTSGAAALRPPRLPAAPQSLAALQPPTVPRSPPAPLPPAAPQSPAAPRSLAYKMYNKLQYEAAIVFKFLQKCLEV